MPHYALAQAFLAGEPDVEQLIQRATQALGPARWIPRVARQFLKAFPLGKTRPRNRDVVRFLRRDRGFQQVAKKLSVVSWMTEPPRMQPVAVAAVWSIPPIETVSALADWLQVSPTELEWFADLQTLNG